MSDIAEKQAALRAPFPDSEIGKLPRVTCPQCRDSKSKVCQEHSKSKCDVCGNYITNRHIHLDYVGHAELTDRLLDVDPEWTWEPAAWGEDGPVITKQGGNLVMWGRLTLCGMTRLGVGTAPAMKDDAHKELIGDFLRNAAMRFGVALDLWRKSEKAEMEADVSEMHDPPADVAACPSCHAPVEGARSSKEPMRRHMVDVHGWVRQDDGTVAKPAVDDPGRPFEEPALPLAEGVEA